MNSLNITISRCFVVIVAFLSVCGTLNAQSYHPCQNCDTIPSRYYKYYYYQWYDELPFYGLDDSSCYYEDYSAYNVMGGYGKWEYAKNRMKINGLVALVDVYANHEPFDDTVKLPEYLYLYQVVGKNDTLRNDPLAVCSWPVWVDLVLIDSVRWDTAQPHYMVIDQGDYREDTRYVYAYEAYFDHPVYVDSDFYIFGSGNSNIRSPKNDLVWQYIPTFYSSIEGQTRVVDSLCPDEMLEDRGTWLYYNIGPYEYNSANVKGHLCFQMNTDNGVRWMCPWPDNYYGLYLAIVDQWDLHAEPSNELHGSVLGGGRYPDESYDTIVAVPANGYRFVHWNDGVTDSVRSVFLTKDTTFTAYFVPINHFYLEVFSSDSLKGQAFGGGSFPTNHVAGISAIPTHGYVFSCWNDGNSDNPRQVTLTKDTVFTAFFEDAPRYNVALEANDNEWGIVDGYGVYVANDTALITAYPFEGYMFDEWDDNVWYNPRRLIVTNDTLITAIFQPLQNVAMIDDLELNIIPNPAINKLTISVNVAGEKCCQIFNDKGVVAQKLCFETFSTEADISSLPRGHYMICLTTAQGCAYKHFVKW
ncbi:MAG: hypothetical protein K6D59_04860 [Bacteroidales bacterium]|nr:hypothetical protein [Bacteroidales bacterium]